MRKLRLKPVKWLAGDHIGSLWQSQELTQHPSPSPGLNSNFLSLRRACVPRHWIRLHCITQFRDIHVSSDSGSTKLPASQQDKSTCAQLHGTTALLFLVADLAVNGWGEQVSCVDIPWESCEAEKGSASPGTNLLQLIRKGKEERRWIESIK